MWNGYCYTISNVVLINKQLLPPLFVVQRNGTLESLLLSVYAQLCN